jgi:hypothetical protein
LIFANYAFIVLVSGFDIPLCREACCMVSNNGERSYKTASSRWWDEAGGGYEKGATKHFGHLQWV